MEISKILEATDLQLSQQQSTFPKTSDEDPLTTEKVRELFKHIPLTEEEEAISLFEAFKKKEAIVKEAEIRNERIRKVQLIKKMWTASECYGYALERGRNIGVQRGFDFVIDDDNRKVFELVSQYFSLDKKFEANGHSGKKYSLNKGICLLSPIRGSGKTTLLDCFMYNKRGCFIKRNTKLMANDYQRQGLKAVERFMWLLPAANSAGNFFQDHYGIHFDDFGDEDAVMHMGNKKMISAMVINSIYDDHRDENLFWRFHISMNYTWDQYEQKFGSNTASRMEEMFNLIPVPGKSRRG